MQNQGGFLPYLSTFFTKPVPVLWTDMTLKTKFLDLDWNFALENLASIVLNIYDK